MREHNGDWWYVVGPGLDEPLLAVKRNGSGTQLWPPVVSDGQGQLIAIADSGGQLNGALLGPQYDAGLWNSSGLTSNSHSFNPRRWATQGQVDTISTFRARQYDPATGKWLQEDPIGIAGGVNLYDYNGNDPNSFSDPFGLCPEWLDGIPCVDPVGTPMAPANSPEPSGAGGSEFGMTRSGGTQMHNGFDWAAPVGTVVKAPGAGTATAIDAGGKEGNEVRFRLTTGTQVSVLHMSSFTGVKSGQTIHVSAGQVVGRTGRTGNAAESLRDPHAHVITRGTNGKPCNPRDFFSPTGGRGSCGSL